ncbi:MAG: FAD-dependent monooxygenase, partial [Actinomycetota bacterium]|nr:FAD-dependent monooxygenase [Actinomycetota bacterium]
MNGNERIRRTEVTPPRAEPYEDEVEVAVVGAGPAGLTTATMLSAYGIRTVVLARAAGPA